MHFGVPSKQHRSTEESLFLIFRITARRLQIMLHDSTTFSFSHCTQLIPTVLSPQTVVGLTQTSQVLQVKKTRCRLLFRGFTRLALTSTSSEWTVSFNVRMNWTYQSKRGLRCSVSVFFQSAGDDVSCASQWIYGLCDVVLTMPVAPVLATGL